MALWCVKSRRTRRVAGADGRRLNTTWNNRETHSTLQLCHSMISSTRDNAGKRNYCTSLLHRPAPAYNSMIGPRSWRPKIACCDRPKMPTLFRKISQPICLHSQEGNGEFAKYHLALATEWLISTWRRLNVADHHLPEDWSSTYAATSSMSSGPSLSPNAGMEPLPLVTCVLMASTFQPPVRYCSIAAFLNTFSPM